MICCETQKLKTQNFDARLEMMKGDVVYALLSCIYLDGEFGFILAGLEGWEISWKTFRFGRKICNRFPVKATLQSPLAAV